MQEANSRPTTPALDLSPPLPLAPPPEPAPPRRGLWRSSGARWLLELATVFVGVYAAFLLNNHQTSRASALRREQILVFLEKSLAKSAESIRASETQYDRDTDDFLHRLAAGEMPTLTPLDWSTGSSFSDQSWLLQSGGLDLLDIDTLASIKDRESVFATYWNRITHFQQLSDVLIAPHVGEPPDFFYDPATHQLRPRYAYYPDVLRYGTDFFRDMHATTDRALAQIKKERQKYGD